MKPFPLLTALEYKVFWELAEEHSPWNLPHTSRVVSQIVARLIGKGLITPSAPYKLSELGKEFWIETYKRVNA